MTDLLKIIVGLLFIAAAIVPGIMGLILAFHASLILGIIVLVVQPTPTILGWLAIFGCSDVAVRLAHWMHLPF